MVREVRIGEKAMKSLRRLRDALVYRQFKSYCALAPWELRLGKLHLPAPAVATPHVLGPDIVARAIADLSRGTAVSLLSG